MMGYLYTIIRISFGGIWVVVFWVLIVDIFVDDMADVVDRTNLGCPSGLFPFSDCRLCELCR